MWFNGHIEIGIGARRVLQDDRRLSSKAGIGSDVAMMSKGVCRMPVIILLAPSRNSAHMARSGS